MFNHGSQLSIMFMALTGIRLDTVIAGYIAYFSPGVSTSPNATGVGWEIAFLKAQSFTASLSLEEKLSMVTGYGTRQTPR
jgi:hypothetical protein